MLDLLPRADALKEMARSPVLLVLANEQRLQVPGKVYEYMATGNHILAIAEEKSATAEVVNHVGGVVVLGGDVVQMKQLLSQWYKEFQEHAAAGIHLMRDPNRSMEYDWSRLASRYVSVLDGRERETI